MDLSCTLNSYTTQALMLCTDCQHSHMQSTHTYTHHALYTVDTHTCKTHIHTHPNPHTVDYHCMISSFILSTLSLFNIQHTRRGPRGRSPHLWKQVFFPLRRNPSTAFNFLFSRAHLLEILTTLWLCSDCSHDSAILGLLTMTKRYNWWWHNSNHIFHQHVSCTQWNQRCGHTLTPSRPMLAVRIAYRGWRGRVRVEVAPLCRGRRRAAHIVRKVPPGSWWGWVWVRVIAQLH